MKKAGYIFLTILEVLFLIGTYIITYFTKKKMGMARHIAFKNKYFQENLNIELIKRLSIGIIVVLTIIVLVLFFYKRLKLSKFTKIINMIMVITTALFVIFVLINSIETIKTYYYVSLMIGIASFIQIIKALLSIIIKSKTGSICNG